MKILVATDGSLFGSRAVAKAGELLTSQHNPEIRIITAYEMPLPAMTEQFVAMAAFSQEIADKLKLNAEKIALNAARGLSLSFPNASINSAVAMGDPGTAIVSAAKDWDADLIVIGSHGHGFLGRMFLGSVSDYVVHNAPCTVMVVRTAENAARQKQSSQGRVIVASSAENS